MVFVALLSRNDPAAERADIRRWRLIPGGDVLVSLSRHAARLAASRTGGQPGIGS
jgi:hypothetical protein